MDFNLPYCCPLSFCYPSILFLSVMTVKASFLLRLFTGFLGRVGFNILLLMKRTGNGLTCVCMNGSHYVLSGHLAMSQYLLISFLLMNVH